MCLKNEGKVVKKIKKHKMNLTYINMVYGYYTIQMQTGKEVIL